MPYKVELPDIDTMFNLIDEISELNYKKSMLDLEIKFEEARITRVATEDPSFYTNGKIPSMSFIESTWKVTGFAGELVSKRVELSKLSADLDRVKLKFQLYRELIDLYRTQSANERSAIV